MIASCIECYRVRPHGVKLVRISGRLTLSSRALQSAYAPVNLILREAQRFLAPDAIAVVPEDYAAQRPCGKADGKCTERSDKSATVSDISFGKNVVGNTSATAVS